MNNQSSQILAPTIIDPEPGAAELSESGHWGETQVIESIKDANLRHKDPRRALNGQVTQALEGLPAASGPMVGQLVLTKPRKRTRIKRFFSYLSS